jgi:DNA-binding transcriptional LysR family regulator
MDFRHLRAFIAVAEESSVTKAAERLHISQPPLSRHIRQLEDELGVTLFVRHRQGVTLTDPGRGLLEKARVLAAAASDFYETAGQATHGDSNKIRIGIGWGLWDTVNKVRVEFARNFANVAIEGSDVFCHDQYAEVLRSRSFDVLFARPPIDPECMNAVPLFQERLVVLLSDANPLASRKTLRIRDLADEPLLLFDRHIQPVVYDKALDLYSKAAITPKTIPTPGAGPYNHAGIMAVASGKGVYVCIGIPLTSPQPASGVALVPISDPDATIDIYLVWRKGETSSKVLQFLDCAQRVFLPQRQAQIPSRRAS